MTANTKSVAAKAIPDSRKPYYSHGHGSWVVPLTKGRVALIDEVDVERVGQHLWRANVHSERRQYAYTDNGVYMHRFIRSDVGDLCMDAGGLRSQSTVGTST